MLKATVQGTIKIKKTKNPSRGPLPLGWLLVWTYALGVTSSALAQTSAQEASPPKRPKIGLALSGGGARGFAHIGVLQWFEEHRVPVHYIAGTSMGGLVGGLYATGKSPRELRELVSDLDWDTLLRGYPTFQQLSYRRKEDRLYIPGPITLGLRRGVRLPTGMNAGMEIGLVFDRLVLPYDNVGSFDELPIPFRCVATDLVAAEPVVLKAGLALSFAPGDHVDSRHVHAGGDRREDSRRRRRPQQRADRRRQGDGGRSRDRSGYRDAPWR